MSFLSKFNLRYLVGFFFMLIKLLIRFFLKKTNLMNNNIMKSIGNLLFYIKKKKD